MCSIHIDIGNTFLFTTVTGYVRLKGDCAGHDLKQISALRKACGDTCNKMQTCKGFLYILPAEKKFPFPPCHLKGKMCQTPINIQGLDISAYFKKLPERK